MSAISEIKNKAADLADTFKLEANRAVKKVAPDTYDPLVWNPLLQYPRNNGCLCESGKKWKKCCGPLQPALIPRSEAMDIVKSLRALNRVFHPEKT